jgi:HAE1 family hydrophobic/amphiphilic exporter-1
LKRASRSSSLYAIRRHLGRRALRYVIWLVLLRALAATAFMYNHVPTAFIPQEDQGYFLIIVQTPPGASLSYTSEFADRGADLVRKNDDVFGTFSVMGFSLSAEVRRTPA